MKCEGRRKKYFCFIWGNRWKIDLHRITAKYLSHCRKRSFKKLWPQWDLNLYICFQETSWVLSMEKGGGFLKKLWYCLVGEYNRVIKYYNLSWWCKLATIKSFKVDVISFWQRASTQSNSFETLYGGLFVFLTQLIILNSPIIPSAVPGSHKLAAKQV